MTADERRQYPRADREIEFVCYVDGQRFDSSSVNVSASGALLKTRAEIPSGTLVVLHPRKAKVKLQHLVLVGKVVHQHDGFVAGLGVEWVRCFSDHGAAAVYDFLLFFLNISAAEVPIPSPKLTGEVGAGFDFKRRKFYQVNLKRQAADAEQDGPRNYRTVATMPDEILDGPGEIGVPPGGDTVPATRVLPKLKSGRKGVMTNMLKSVEMTVPVKFPVRVVIGGEVHTATLREIGLNALLVLLGEAVDPGDDEIMVHLAIPLKDGAAWVRVVCLPIKEKDMEQPPGVMSLGIRRVLDEKSEGLYLRFVRYLCQKMLVDE